MHIHNIISEQEALEQLRFDANKSVLSTTSLLDWLDKKEEQWVGEFEQLSKEAQATDMNHFKINYLIGLSILIPVLDTFRAELQRTKSVFCDPVMKDELPDPNDWGSNDSEIDDWLKK